MNSGSNIQNNFHLSYSGFHVDGNCHGKSNEDGHDNGLPPVRDYFTWSGRRHFERNHPKFTKAINSYLGKDDNGNNTCGAANTLRMSLIKAFHIISKNIALLDEVAEIKKLCNYFFQKNESSSGKRFQHELWLGNGCIQVEKGCRRSEGLANYEFLENMFHDVLKEFWEQESRTSLRTENSFSVKEFFRESVERHSGKFFNLSARHTKELLEKNSFHADGASEPTSVRSQKFLAWSIEESPGEIDELLGGSRQEIAGGHVLSSSGMPELDSLSKIHLIQATQCRSGVIWLPPSGAVVIAMSRADAFKYGLRCVELMQQHPRIAVFIPSGNGPVSHGHMLGLMTELLNRSSCPKTFRISGGNVQSLEGTQQYALPGSNCMRKARPSSPSGQGDEASNYTIWHFPEHKKGHGQLTQAIKVLQFLPRDFPCRGQFVAELMGKLGMDLQTLSPEALTWSKAFIAKGRADETSFLKPFEETYRNMAQLNAIFLAISDAESLLPEEKTHISAVLCELFSSMNKQYDIQLKSTKTKLDGWKEFDIDEPRKAGLKAMVEQSPIREELYDAIQNFVASRQRLLLIEAPCGVGKTLALSLLSATLVKGSCWFSFPTNVLAKEFKKAAPVKAVPVHCKGDIKGSELPKLKRHDVQLKKAVFVHETLLSVIRNHENRGDLNDLTLFVDEWHNLSQKELHAFTDLAETTSVKLVFLSATPRREGVDILHKAFDQRSEHVIRVERAIEEGLLRPRIFLDGTVDSRPDVFNKTKVKTHFDTRLQRALESLDSQIQGKPLWCHSGVIYVNDTKKASQICQALSERYEGLHVYNATGTAPQEPDFEKRPFALVCCRRFKEGANIKALGYVITLESLTDVDAVQIAGRLSRRSDRSDELPYGLFLAFGDGSGEKSQLRSDPTDQDVQQDFLSRCQGPEGQPLLDVYPRIPEQSRVTSNLLRLPLNDEKRQMLWASMQKKAEKEMLGRKQERDEGEVNPQDEQDEDRTVTESDCSV